MSAKVAYIGFTMMTLYNDQFKAYIPENIKEGDDNWDLTPSIRMHTISSTPHVTRWCPSAIMKV